MTVIALDRSPLPLRRRKTTIDSVWRNMIARCMDPDHDSYRNYGARGIAVCDRWLSSLSAFGADMGARPPGAEIDRIENDKGYEPGNCRWVTRIQNQRNKRDNRVVEFSGRRQPLAAWAEEVGLPYNTIRNRLDRGWPVARALTEGINVPFGERARHAKLTEAAVREMLCLHAAGESVRRIARRFDYSSGSTWKIVNRHTWRHVDVGPRP